MDPGTGGCRPSDCRLESVPGLAAYEVAEDQPVPVVERDRKAYTLTIEERAIAAAEIYQG